MSKMGEMVQEIQEIVEDSFVHDEEEILRRVGERFQNRLEFQRYAIEIAKFEIKTIKQNLEQFTF